MTFMTAHELARLLLEGPDLPVFYDVGGGYDEPEPSLIGATEPVTLWQVNYGSRAGWSLELHFDKPKNEKLETRAVDAVRLR